MKAYLSGGMEHAVDDGADWRRDMTKWLAENLGHDVVDPVVESAKIVTEHDAEDYRDWKISDSKKYKHFIRKLIARDIRGVIEESDYVICLWDESVMKGGGTHGEVTLAYHFGIPVYLINTIPMEDLSGWIFSCSTEVFNSFDALKIHLEKTYH
ncbi:MAG: hypothetical protein HOD97_07495 [Candidatus Marinimicrobia bacterium]|jgi:hypothetical protein|nr:hypothetical protein [Candidatus Neomarinimicrobiota bacterium]MBT3618334.1 hypothetical protein [Candidatus Neomarinimicrobiota bacterium]MBT3829129.1 hypothetical protein [Candidatus Neomarinimicrobiota bacterium]MBT3998097.1 hypothetical protein [Candidatus Neomarinimicrobiota bacterium]MBT4281438.1 hypothetical protein [Candidatus Neomarinimicrobiota bacterium]